MDRGYVARAVRKGDVIYEITTPGMNASTRFELASVSKQFTGAAAVAMFGDALFVTRSAFAKKLIPAATACGYLVFDLLRHKSGIPDYYAMFDALGFYPSKYLEQADVPDLIRAAGRPWKPGKYRYSNAGYDLLAWAIEKETSAAFGEYLYGCIFEPLGMAAHTGPYREKSYVFNYLANELEHESPHPLDGIVGAGGIWCSLDDLTAWVQSDIYETNRYGTYGDTHDGFARRGHDGRWKGWSAALWHYEDTATDIFAMANSEEYEADEIVKQIAREIL